MTQCFARRTKHAHIRHTLHTKLEHEPHLCSSVSVRVVRLLGFAYLGMCLCVEWSTGLSSHIHVCTSYTHTHTHTTHTCTHTLHTHAHPIHTHYTHMHTHAHAHPIHTHTHRPAICIFYLVLRALDTVEDDMTIPVQEKVPMLKQFHTFLYAPQWNYMNSKEKDKAVLEEFPTVKGKGGDLIGQSACVWHVPRLALCTHVLVWLMCTMYTHPHTHTPHTPHTPHTTHHTHTHHTHITYHTHHTSHTTHITHHTHHTPHTPHIHTAHPYTTPRTTHHTHITHHTHTTTHITHPHQYHASNGMPAHIHTIIPSPPMGHDCVTHTSHTCTQHTSHTHAHNTQHTHTHTHTHTD